MGSAVRAENQSNQSFKFSGRGGEYFRIWIVNLALSIITLGIFSAWAKVRRLKYFYGHTQLDGHHFDYLAQPWRILVGRIIAVVLLVSYSLTTTFVPSLAFYIICLLLLMLPFIVVTASAFSFRNTAYRNIRFHFRRELGAAYRKVALPLLIALVLTGIVYSVIPATLGVDAQGETVSKAQVLLNLLFLFILPFLPWLDHIRTQFVVDHLQYGKTRGSFHGRVWDFYRLYLLMLLYLVVIVGSFIAVLMSSSGVLAGSGGAGPLFFLLLIGVYALMFMGAGWFIAARSNLLRNNTRFGGNALSGNFKGGEMIRLLLGNTLAILFTLGLFTPWAAVRLARYNAAHTQMDVGNLADTVAEAGSDENAIGEELGEFFDIDIGL